MAVDKGNNMTSVIVQPVYEDDKTYPVVFNHRIWEMTGRQIKNRLGSQEITLTASQLQDILDRITALELQLSRKETA